MSNRMYTSHNLLRSKHNLWNFIIRWLRVFQLLYDAKKTFCIHKCAIITRCNLNERHKVRTNQDLIPEEQHHGKNTNQPKNG